MFVKKIATAAPLIFALILGVLPITSSMVIANEPVRFAMIVRGIDDSAYLKAHLGAKEAVEEIGGIDLLYVRPNDSTTQAQITLIDSLIDSDIDVIMISASDASALTPSLQRAASKGIKVITFYQDTESSARSMHVAPADRSQISMGPAMIAKDLIKGGDVAVLGGSENGSSHNDWVNDMVKLTQEDSGLLKGINVVEVAYGDDQSDTSYQEALRMIKEHPDIKAIVAYTPTGLSAASQMISDEDLVGKVAVTGLGFPTDMLSHVKSGASPVFTMWNMVDVGYSTVQLANALVTGMITGKPGDVIKAGRMGYLSIDDNGTAIVGALFVYDANNVEEAVSLSMARMKNI